VYDDMGEGSKDAAYRWKTLTAMPTPHAETKQGQAMDRHRPGTADI
jgi:hypothetical protein